MVTGAEKRGNVHGSMSIFLTEHAGEIAVAWYGIATVLLLVTLHR